MWAKLAWVSIGLEKGKNGRFRLYDSLFSVTPAGANKMREANLGTPHSHKAFQKQPQKVNLAPPPQSTSKKTSTNAFTSGRILLNSSNRNSSKSFICKSSYVVISSVSNLYEPLKKKCVLFISYFFVFKASYFDFFIPGIHNILSLLSTTIG